VTHLLGALTRASTAANACASRMNVVYQLLYGRGRDVGDTGLSLAGLRVHGLMLEAGRVTRDRAKNERWADAAHWSSRRTRGICSLLTAASPLSRWQQFSTLL
jgi:hypothetical protein